MTLDLFEWKMPKVVITRSGYDPARGREVRDPTLEGKPATIEERALSFHALNPHVFTEMLRLAGDQLARGTRYISAKALWEELRVSLSALHGEYKLNNSFTAVYARMCIEADPRLIGVIEVRQRRAR